MNELRSETYWNGREFETNIECLNIWKDGGLEIYEPLDQIEARRTSFATLFYVIDGVRLNFERLNKKP